MVSPTTENRKWPGPIMPACTGPTGISYTPVPSTIRKPNGPSTSPNGGGSPAPASIGCHPVGQWKWRTSRLGIG